MPGAVPAVALDLIGSGLGELEPIDFSVTSFLIVGNALLISL